MKITGVKVISFTAKTNAHRTKWGYGVKGEEHDIVQRIMKIETDEGPEGIFTGGNGYFFPPAAEVIEELIKPLLVGEDRFCKNSVLQPKLDRPKYNIEPCI